MANSDAIRVVLVDDQALVRSGFKLLINSQDDMTVVGEAADGADVPALIAGLAGAPGSLAGSGGVDVVLMDVQMPVMNGIEATSALVGAALSSDSNDVGEPKVIMLTTFDDQEYVRGAIEAGASGFLLKDAEPEELLGAIRTVHSGNAVLSPKVTAQVLKSLAASGGADFSRAGSGSGIGAGAAAAMDVPVAPVDAETTSILETLTPRERDILRLIALGLSNDEIASHEFVSMATVKTHVRHILMKTGSRDRVHAVLFAYRAGLVDVGEMLGYS